MPKTGNGICVENIIPANEVNQCSLLFGDSRIYSVWTIVLDYDKYILDPKGKKYNLEERYE